MRDYSCFGDKNPCGLIIDAGIDEFDFTSGPVTLQRLQNSVTLIQLHFASLGLEKDPVWSLNEKCLSMICVSFFPLLQLNLLL